MRSLNMFVLVVASSLAFACGSSTPTPETPTPEAAEAPVGDTAVTAPAADAGAPVHPAE